MSNQDIQHQEENFRNSDADLRAEQLVDDVDTGRRDPTVAVFDATSEKKCPYHFVPLRMGGNGGTHKISQGSRALIQHEVSLDDLRRMTHKFYEFAFEDDTLDKLIHSHDDPHGDRFAKWIHQKLSGSNVWDEDRRTRDLTPKLVAGGRSAVVHDRSSAHVAAWHSAKRPANEVGRHFNLGECRVWMRLHFWAMRESGVVEQSPSFADYYVRFIGHFVAVYERSAPAFAQESFRWSADPSNIDKYVQSERKMTDVLGTRFQEAIKDLPDEEVRDDEWPYYVTNQQ